MTRIAAAWLTVAGFGWPLPSQAAHPTVCSAVDHGTGISSVECIIITGHRYRPEPPRPRPALIPGLSFGIGSSNAGASYGAIVKPLRADRRSEESLAKQKAENNSQRDDSCTDNPVVIATGEKLKDETDFTSSGLYGMSLVRTYRSAQSGGNLFGRNWRSSPDFPALLFSGCLIDRELPGCQGPTAITFTDSDGARYIYDYDGGTDDYLPRGARAAGGVIWGSKYTGWGLSRQDSTYHYSKSGVIQRVTDRGGVTAMTFEHNASGQLTKITDAVGRTVTFGRTNNRVTTVTDPAGRAWT